MNAKLGRVADAAERPLARVAAVTRADDGRSRRIALAGAALLLLSLSSLGLLVTARAGARLRPGG
jgi:hypothetical protein